MLKVLAAVFAVLIAAISITIYTATLPDVQKEAADNAAAIETLSNQFDNIPTTEKYYIHNIKVSDSSLSLSAYFTIITKYSTEINTFTSLLSELFNNNDDILKIATGIWSSVGNNYKIVGVGINRFSQQLAFAGSNYNSSTITYVGISSTSSTLFIYDVVQEI